MSSLSNIESAIIQHAKVDVRTLYGPQIKVNYPVPGGKSIQFLVQYFCSATVLPSAVALPDSLTLHVQTTWMRRAMADPCLFHATLFCASEHQDGVQNISNNPQTAFHQAQALKLLRERLAVPQFQVNYETVATVVALGFFSMVANNEESAHAHNNGVLNLLRMCPNEETDSKNFIGLINMTLLTFSMLQNKDIHLLPLHGTSRDGIPPGTLLLGVRPSTILKRIISRATVESVNNGKTILTNETLIEIHKVFTAVLEIEDEALRMNLEPAICSQRLDFPRRRGADEDRIPVPESPGAILRNINRCCRLAADVFWDVLWAPHPEGEQYKKLNESLDALKATLPKIDFISWLRYAPEAYVWICFTAGAACPDQIDRSAFVLTPMPVVTAMDSTELLLQRQAWRYFKWLSGAHVLRRSITFPGSSNS